MPTRNETIPLWSSTPPGVIASGQEQHERAKETPQLKLFLLEGSAPRPLVVVMHHYPEFILAARWASEMHWWGRRLGFRVHLAEMLFSVVWRVPVPNIALVTRKVRGWVGCCWPAMYLKQLF